jgi:YbbR domain-containing protein
MMKIPSFIPEKVKIVLTLLRNKSFLTFLFFLTLSTAFWIFEAFKETNTVELTVPLELTNVPDNVVVTTELPHDVTVQLRDRNSSLFYYRYFKQLQPVKVDFAHYTNPSGHVKVPQEDVKRSVIQQFETSTELVALRPDTLEFYYNYGTKKTVNTRLQGKLSAAEGYYIVSQRLHPETATVYATDRQLDTITTVRTTPFYAADLKENLMTTVGVQRVKGAKFLPDTLRLEVEVDRLVEKTLALPIQAINFPDDVGLRTFPMKVNVTFQVGMKEFRNVTEKDFTLVLDANDLTHPGVNTCPLQLESSPKNVFRPRLSQSEVEFLIEKKSEQ